MAQGPKPFGRVKSLRVPAGKEDEYVEDNSGEPIHVQYGVDEELQGIVLPTGKHFRQGGGSHGFNVNDMDTPQNIVVYDESGQRTVTQVTRRELATGLSGVASTPAAEEATPEVIEKLGERAESMFLGVKAATQAAAAAAVAVAAVEAAPAAPRGMYDPFEEEPMAKKKAKKKSAKLRRGVESAPPVTQPQPQVQAQERAQAAPPTVKITGPFGTVTAAFSGVFRDNMCLVLYSDARQLSSLYTLPEAEEPVLLTIEYEGHVVSCLWAGIQFTMPNTPVTFIVLLVADEVETAPSADPGFRDL